MPVALSERTTWERAHHAICPLAVRESPELCAACHDAHFGDPVADRRCYCCSTDAYWQGEWSMVNGRLVCADCAADLAAGLPFLRARALYRGRTQGDPAGPEARQLGVYRELVDFKEHLGRWGALAVPLGNALAQNVRLLIEEESIPCGALLIPAPSFQDRRLHIRRLAEQAARSLPDLEFAPEVLEKIDDFRQATLGRAERRARSAVAYRARAGLRLDVLSRPVIVVDDFFTSGATLFGCSVALRAAGAAAVYGAPLVRVVAPPATMRRQDRAVRLRLEWLAVADNGMVASGVPSGTMWCWVYVACARCPMARPHGALPTPAEGTQLSQAIDCECGSRQLIHIQQRDGRLFVRVDGRRSSELWLAPWREDT